jgi:protein-L-isoaspartate(D-aspartate) O-methyltransferase
VITDRHDHEAAREAMVARQLRARGILSPLVLAAMRKVPREGYVPSYLGEFAYDDSALPIEEEQTISQPYIVGYMIEALQLQGGERVLEVGTGSGYAAAVLAEIAGEVWTIERHERLATTARERLQRDGYANVHVKHGDGTLGWPEHAPFDAIVVAAGGPRVPESLRQQLAIGGRMVLPVGEAGDQHLVRVTRDGPRDFRQQRLADVRFVPLIGAEGWQAPAATRAAPARATRIAKTIARGCEPFTDVDALDLQPLLQRIGDARVVLLGEATHGTAEFYRFRDVLTRALVQQRGFDVVAIEGDWPDAARIDHYVRDRAARPQEWQAFARFPTWMWRNREFATFVDWLRMHNGFLAPERRVRFAGLDLYAMHTSIDGVLRHLDAVDPQTAAVARHRYGCLTPWQADPAAYGRAVLTGAYRSCEPDVVRVLEAMLRQRLDAGEDAFDALQNARLVAGAERYYRAMYYGAHEAWNLRDRHMFDCLRQLLAFRGESSRVVVWAHNSHVGDARATEMPARGEWNLGQLCREELPEGATCAIGFGTDQGVVAAASYWGGDVEFKRLRPSQPHSYERLCHDSGVPNFVLPLRAPRDPELRDLLHKQRLQRAIGVIYRPETELASHYGHVELARQFDEYVWFDRTTAVQPLTTADVHGMPDTYPFGL